MEVIWLILIIIFAVVSSKDRKKKAARKLEQELNRNLRESARQGPTSSKPVVNASPKPLTNGSARRGNVASLKSASQMSVTERRERMEELRRKRAERQSQTGGLGASNARADFESSLTELRELLDAAPHPEPGEGESLFRNDDCAGGSMAHDHAEGVSALSDAECAGGSMPHRHTQGESREEHARHIAAMEARDAEEAAAAALRRGISAADMRRAVVMAEVLGKPKAIRGAAYRR